MSIHEFLCKKKIIFPAILLILSTVIALSIAEVALRILNIGYGSAPQESHPVFHHVHPSEYRFLSHIPSGEYGNDEIYYDADRLVSNPDVTHVKKTHSSCLAVFLGDSFTEAGQVAYRNSFTGILDHDSDCVIKNYGVSSYSPIFYLLQWRAVIKATHPTLVVAQLYSNDIAADKNYAELAKKDEHGQVIAIPGPQGSWLTNQLRKSYLMRFLRKVQLQFLWMYENRNQEQHVIAGMVEENPDITTLSAELITSLAREVKASGAQFVLTVVPSKFRLIKHLNDSQSPQFSAKWRLFSKKNNIEFMDLTRPFENETLNGKQLFFNNDIHFNENGHRVVAAELSKNYPL